MTDEPSKLVDGELVPLKGAELADYLDRAANPPTPPLPPVITNKADIWRRCSEAEAELLDGALANATAQMRRVFEGAQYIDHSDPFFAVLRDAVVAMVGQARADQILAGSS